MKFVSDISLMWLLPWAIISILCSYYLYKNEGWLLDLKKQYRYLIKGLRASGIFLVGILLIGILFEAVHYRIEKPVFISLIDNSSSMRNYKDSTEVQARIEGFERKLKLRYGNKFNFVRYTVGSEVKENGAVSLDESISALSVGFDQIRTNFYNRNIGGIAFISDGNFNTGSNPIYSVEKISLTPVFSLGVGDTVPKKDQYLKNVTSNEIAFLHNKFPVEVDVEAVKMGKSSATVTVFHKGKAVATQTINYSNEDLDYRHLSFLLEATSVGFQQYSVSISNGVGECNFKNNHRNFYVEVIDTRSKILVLAGAPHPDIAAIKSVVENDENLELVTKLSKDWDGDLKGIHCVLWHEPGVNYDQALHRKLQEAKLPILYCIGPNTSTQVIQKLTVGLSVSGGNQTDEVQAKFNSGFQLFEASEALQAAFQYYPPLVTRFGEARITAGNEVALYQRIGSIQKKEPLLFFGSEKGVKHGVLYGEGVWRWKMNEYVRSGEQKNFEELIQKILQYLVVKENTTSLRITLPKRFSKDESMFVKAEFYNKALELITTPQIEFILENESGKVKKHQFAVIGNFYKLALGELKPGKYQWKAQCKHDGKNYSKSGGFIVEEQQLENLESHANHTVLHQIASQSNGAFYTLKQSDQLLNDLEKRGDIAEMSYRESSFDDLLDYKWLFFLLILIFGLEWFLRRWFGAY